MQNKFKENIKYENINGLQDDIETKLVDFMDLYSKSNSFENREFLCYLCAAIFLTYKKLYPQINIHIPFRTKSDLSAIRNVQKEFSKWSKNSDMKDQFDISPIVKDLSGIRIVLDNINLSLPKTNESYKLFNDETVKKELEITQEHHRFLNKVDKYLLSSIQSGEKYYELKIELLKKIIECTPPEFTEERTPHPSFKQMLDETMYQYNYYLSDPDEGFPTIISQAESEDLMNLANTLRSRAHDNLHFAILRKTLPVVLSSPLVKNSLLTSFEYDKEILKPNTFHALYNNLHTPFGDIEVIAQSNKAYYDSTKGSAYHSGIEGKTIAVKDFFELTNPDDKHPLSYYLNILDNISADSLVSPYELPHFKSDEEKQDFLKTPKGLAYLESNKYRKMMQHIRIKDKIEIIPSHLPKDVYDDANSNVINKEKLQEKIESGEVVPTVVDTNDFLFSSALFSSPYMNVCSAGHTSFANASIHHKKIIGEFAEVLRKRDSNTCLRDMILRRLEELIRNHGRISTDDPNKPISTSMKRNLQIVSQRNIDANKLPKDISVKNISDFAHKLRNNPTTVLEQNDGR